MNAALLGVMLGIAHLAGSCARRPAVESDIREYVRLAVALGERDPDSLDFYYGPADWVADVRQHAPALPDIRRSALALAARMANDRNPRVARMRRQVEAIAARADALLGSRTSFDRETKAYFGLELPPRNDSTPGARSELNGLLGGSGNLAARYAALDEKFIIPPERLAAVMERAIEGCREQTLAHLKLPPSETITLEYVRNQPWSGFSRYQGNFRSVIQINSDLGFTVNRALQLACHEGYPGHHVYNVIQDLQFVRSRGWIEWTVQPTFSPQSLVSEGMATFALEMAFPEPDRLRFERDRLFPLAGLNPQDAERDLRAEQLADKLRLAELAIARDYLDGKLEWARAAAALEDRAAMARPEETLKYMNEYRSNVVTYTLGSDLVEQRVNSAANRWRTFEALMTDPDAALALRSMIGK